MRVLKFQWLFPLTTYVLNILVLRVLPNFYCIVDFSLLLAWKSSLMYTLHRCNICCSLLFFFVFYISHYRECFMVLLFILKNNGAAGNTLCEISIYPILFCLFTLIFVYFYFYFSASFLRCIYCLSFNSSRISFVIHFHMDNFL